MPILGPIRLQVSPLPLSAVAVKQLSLFKVNALLPRLELSANGSKGRGLLNLSIFSPWGNLLVQKSSQVKIASLDWLQVHHWLRGTEAAELSTPPKASFLSDGFFFWEFHFSSFSLI